MTLTTANLRPPGVYPSMADPVLSPLQLSDTGIAGFIGLSLKGPIDEPTRIASWEQFQEVYGYTPDFYLSRSVEAFFQNGGKICYIVRVAHKARDEAMPTPEHAACAERVVSDNWKKPTLRVRALNEGRWGSNVWVQFTQSTSGRALLTQDLEVGSGEARISSTRGYAVGALVRIFDREHSDFVILNEVEERVIRWGAETPVNRRYKAASPTHFELLEFELHIALRDRREIFTNLQMHPSSRRYITRVVEQESRLVRVEDLKSTSPPQHRQPLAEPANKLTAGRDGTDAVTPEDFVGYDHGPADRAGLMSLVAVEEVCGLVCPDSMLFIDRQPGPEGELKSQRVQDAMIDLCENMKDRFAILDCPKTRDIEVVRRWRRRTDSSYCAYYWPWVGMTASDGSITRIPPSGFMAGTYARVDHDVGVHQVPANTPLRAAVDLSLPVTEDHQGILNNEQINTFRLGRGIRPWGARTASSDPDWRFINVRRLFIMMRRSLEAGMQWVVFEPNYHKTWESLTDMVTVFLRTMFEKGMFARGNPEDCFFVRCNEETNPRDAVAKGVLTCEIGVAPAVPTEFIMIRVTQKMGEATAAAAGAAP